VRLICGIDLGQANDPSTLCAVEPVKLAVPIFRRKYRYVIRLLDEYPLGVSYPDQVAKFVGSLSHPALVGSRCGVDYTGVGRPVYDLLKQAKPPVMLYPVLTTGGHAITFDEKTREVHVPKVELVSLLQVLLQADLINWHPRLPTAPKLKEQLAKFRVKITKSKNEVFGAESGSHDDLVSAVMTACFLGEHFGAGDAAGIVTPEGKDRSVTETAPAGVFLGSEELSREDRRR